MTRARSFVKPKGGERAGSFAGGAEVPCSFTSSGSDWKRDRCRNGYSVLSLVQVFQRDPRRNAAYESGAERLRSAKKDIATMRAASSTLCAWVVYRPVHVKTLRSQKLRMLIHPSRCGCLRSSAFRAWLRCLPLLSPTTPRWTGSAGRMPMHGMLWQAARLWDHIRRHA